MSAITDIHDERIRQRQKEGWSEDHDDEHTDGSLAQAAAAYALPRQPYRDQTDFYDAETRVANDRDCRAVTRSVPSVWPKSWACWWWKPKDRRRDLVRAGALIVAEIERLDRVESKGRNDCE